MNRKVVSLNRAPKPIAHYLRLGQGFHRQLEELQDSGDLPFDRVVVDASRRVEQRELLQALSEDGKEIIFDPNVAELATVGGAAGQARHLPWAKHEGIWRPSDIDRNALKSITQKIAQATVETGCHAVHSPSHLLMHGASDPWLPIDIEATHMLRDALDTSGGANVSIDYVLSIPYAAFRDTEVRRVIVGQLRDVPFENLWLRIPRFGANSTGAMVRQYISAINDLIEQIGNQPIVADYAGGMPALAVCAFGAAGGIAHGVGEKESFNSSSWTRARSSSFSGRASRVYVPSLGSYLTKKEFEHLWQINGVRSKLICTDPSCCARGKKHMSEKRHVLTQRANQLASLNRVPELSRPEHFVHKQLEDVGQAIRCLERIRALDELPTIKHKISKWSAQTDRLSRQLKELIELRGALARSSHPRRRSDVMSGSSGA